ncbi:hypothetical protein SF23_15345, partial [Streptomyces sp. MBRL 10]
MTEEEGLFGREEAVTADGGRGGGAFSPVGDELGGAADRVGDLTTRSVWARPPPSAPSRAISAARVTASSGGAVVGAPARRAGPKRCQPVWDQWRTATVRAVPDAGRGMRRGVPVDPSGRVSPVSRTQQRRRFSTAADSAATAGSPWSSGSGHAVGARRTRPG